MSNPNPESDLVTAAYIGPKEIGAKAFSVLYADGSEQRVRVFRMKSAGEGYQFRVLRSSAELEQTLREPKPWDVLMHSLYLGNWKESPTANVEVIQQAFLAGRLRGVICTSTVQEDAKKFVAALRGAGVPCTYVPFSYATPAAHTQHKLSEFKYFGEQER